MKKVFTVLLALVLLSFAAAPAPAESESGCFEKVSDCQAGRVNIPVSKVLF